MTTDVGGADAAFVAPAPHRVFEVTGTDRLTYLDDVLSQQLRDVGTGRALGALYLDVHGAPLGAFDVLVLEDRVLLLAPDAEDAVAAVDLLASRTFLADAHFRATSDVVVAVRGDHAIEGAPEPGQVGSLLDALVLGRPAGMDLIVDRAGREQLQERLADLGVRPTGPEELERWRIARGVPAWGAEIVAPHLPEELGLLPTHVHLAKGCYPGQEAVARMWMLGRPRRRLAMVRLEGDALEPGWACGSGRDRVAVTSSDRLGCGLAFVPSDAEVGGTYVDADGAVTIVGFVGDGRSVPGHDPAVARRRDRRAAAAGH